MPFLMKFDVFVLIYFPKILQLISDKLPIISHRMPNAQLLFRQGPSKYLTLTL